MPDVDHALAAQQAAEEHLTACWDSVDDEAPEPETFPETLGPFCGCLTCEVREVLHAAYPHLRRLWEEEREHA